MEVVTATLIKILAGMPHLAILLVGLFLAKLFFQVTSRYKFSEELTAKDNPAFGVCLSGYLVGTGIALYGALFGATGILTEDAAGILVGVVAIIILMRLGVVVNDAAILFRFSIRKELSHDRNVGTGFVVAGSCIATGWMLNGVLSGVSTSLLTSIRDIVVYWALGQVILILGGILFQFITRYDVHKIIGGENNLPAGISFGGFLVALGIITRNALFGATSRLGEEILITIIFALVGMVLLTLTRIIADRVFLPGSPLSKEIAEDRNPAAGAIAAASFVVAALIFAAAVNPHPTPVIAVEPQASTIEAPALEPESAMETAPVVGLTAPETTTEQPPERPAEP